MSDAWKVHWKDYYDILQVSFTAEIDVIEGAYKRLAAKYHPDKSTGNEERMKLINQAYEVLRDPSRRQRYDSDYRNRGEINEIKAREREAKAQADKARQHEQAAREEAEAARRKAEEAARKEEEARRKAEEATRRAQEAGLQFDQSVAASQAKKDEQNMLEQAGYRVKDAFSKDLTGFFVGESTAGKMSLANGHYRMESIDKKDNYLVQISKLLGRHVQFSLETRALKLAGSNESNFGLWWGDPWPGNFHEFTINGAGRLRITKHLQTGGHHEWHVLSELHSTPINLGNATNVLKIVRVPGTFHFFANGQYITTVRDSSVESGWLGFVLGCNAVN